MQRLLVLLIAIESLSATRTYGYKGGFHCPSEGYHPHPTICRKFYRCVNKGDRKEIIMYRCDPKTVFDPDVNGCNYKWNILPPKRCHFPFQLPRVPMVHWNRFRTPAPSRAPQHPAKHPDGAIRTPGRPGAFTKKPQFSRTTTPEREQPTTQPFLNHSTNRFGDGPGSNLEPELPFNPFPNPDSPQVPASQDPPDWNPSIPDFPLVPGGPQGDSVEPVLPVYIPYDNTDKQSSNLGRIACTSEGFFSHPADCRKFYRCVNQGGHMAIFHFECAPGTVFDPYHHICNYKDRILPPLQCQDEGDQGSPFPGQVPAQIPASPQQPQFPDDWPRPFPESDRPSNPPSAQNPEFPGVRPFFPEEQDREELESVLSEGQIPEELFTLRSLPPVITHPTPKDPEQHIVVTLVGPPLKEEIFGEGSNVNQQTSRPGFIHETDGRKQNNDEWLHNSGRFTCTSEGFFPHPTDCRKFYRCVNQGGHMAIFHFECGPGTVFDPYHHICNYKDRILPPLQCQDEHITYPPPTVSALPDTEPPLPSYGPPLEEEIPGEPSNVNQQTERPGFNHGSSGRKQKSAERTQHSGEFHCPSEGFFPHPKLCTKFYRCVNQGGHMAIFHFECGPGTVFVPRIGVCDHRRNVHPPLQCQDDDDNWGRFPVGTQPPRLPDYPKVSATWPPPYPGRQPQEVPSISRVPLQRVTGPSSTERPISYDQQNGFYDPFQQIVSGEGLIAPRLA